MECREREGPEACGDLRPAGWDMERLHAFITEHWQTKVLSRAQREWGDTEKETGKICRTWTFWDNIKCLASKGMCSCSGKKQKPLTGFKQSHEKTQFYLQKVHSGWQCGRWIEGAICGSWEAIKEVIRFTQNRDSKAWIWGEGWGDKGGSKTERLWDSRKWETLNAVKLS